MENMNEGYIMDGLIRMASTKISIPRALIPIFHKYYIRVMLYRGSIRPGHLDGQYMTIVLELGVIGTHGAVNTDDPQMGHIEINYCLGSGAFADIFSTKKIHMGYSGDGGMFEIF